MDEKRFEDLFQADADKVIAKTKKFCREIYGTDDAQFISDFVAITAQTALKIGGYKRYSKILAFQAEILQDLAAAQMVYEREAANNAR